MIKRRGLLYSSILLIILGMTLAAVMPKVYRHAALKNRTCTGEGQMDVESLLHSTVIVPALNGSGLVEAMIDPESVLLFPPRWAVAEFTVSHGRGKLLLGYQPRTGSNASWTVIDSVLSDR